MQRSASSGGAVMKPCEQCGRATGTINQVSICDPGDEPITVWLHRKCETAFLEQLDADLLVHHRRPAAARPNPPACISTPSYQGTQSKCASSPAPTAQGGAVVVKLFQIRSMATELAGQEDLPLDWFIEKRDCRLFGPDGSLGIPYGEGEGPVIIFRTTHDRAAVVAAIIEQIFATTQGRERRLALEACLREEFADESRQAIADREAVNE
jgi:hypothetical protein